MAEHDKDQDQRTAASESRRDGGRGDDDGRRDDSRRDDNRRDDGRREGGRGDGGRGGRRYYRRKKVDYFSVNKIDDVNYKDVDTLKQFIGDGGKILPRRHTGLSAHHQRLLKRAVKRARNIALLPFGGEG